ncbi:MAG: PAS domain S-box protein [Chitinivibrionales bacterium]|nr:PAS domain S-box protein [Chitinivibrionales bacterium]MBD3356317.1 PAS domain S-box protein [Chitinivibrionales bacterium]
MTNQPNNHNNNHDTSNLRRRAEECLRTTRDQVAAMSTDDVQELVHELQVHQIELEMRNDEMMRIQEEIVRTRDRYVVLYDHAPVGYITLNENLEIREANRTATKLLGHARHTLKGAHLSRFAVPQDQDTCYRHLRAVASTHESGTAEIRFRKIDGDPIVARLWTARTFAPDVGGGELLVTMADITEQKNLEEALDKRARDLETANKELEAFGHSVSHDLRNPLNNILAVADMLMHFYADRLDDDGRRCVREVERNSKRMSSTITDLLRLSHVTRKELSLEPVDLSAMAASIIEELRNTEARDIMNVRIQDAMTASADKGLIYNALYNLLHNAWKYTRANSAPIIEFANFERDHHIIFYIRDNGEGFDMEDAKTLFQPFKRLGTATRYKGTGIGLSLVQRIINRHGGTIWATGEKGKGATFYFTLTP